MSEETKTEEEKSPLVVLNENDQAPEFELPLNEGGTFKLSDARGTPVVLYFYPKDNTSGCTTEACNFRDNMDVISEAGALLYGVSPDTVASHNKFIDKYDLNFPLLADEGAKVAQEYGVWKEKSMYGRKYMGIERTTFLINPDGTIGHIWRKVKVAGHADEVLKVLGQFVW